jgi:hypothetical protein
VAAEVDRQIICNYALHATNLYAYHALHGDDAVLPEAVTAIDGACTEADFDQRMQALGAGERQFALGIYANAVTSKLRYEPAGDVATVAD